jgi:hypothetical protein
VSCPSLFALQKKPCYYTIVDNLLLILVVFSMKNKTLIITLLTIFLGAFQATWAVAEQIPPECAASYAQYEAKIKNISSEVVPKIFLYYSVANSLDKAYLPSSLEEAKNAPLEGLCYYNKLRELYGETPIASLSQLDPEWLEKTELSIWKERAREPKESATGFPKQPQKTKETAQVKEEKQPKEQYFDELFEFVITSLDELKYDKSNTALKAEVLRFYNILRKALGQSEARRFTYRSSVVGLSRLSYLESKLYERSKLT